MRYLLFMLLLITNSVLANEFEQGIRQFKNREFSKAQQTWDAEAKQGNLQAQYHLALMLYGGKYADKDRDGAIALLNEAANKGSPDAALALYIIYSSTQSRITPELRQLLQKYIDNGGRGGAQLLKLEEESFLQRNPMELSHKLDMLLPIEYSMPAENLAPADIAKGRSIYNATCIACHDSGVMNAPKISDKNRWFALVKNGFNPITDNAVRGFKAHPPRGGDYGLSNDDVQRAVYFMFAHAAARGQ